MPDFIDDLKRREGFVGMPYNDKTGKPIPIPDLEGGHLTIGHGIKLPIDEHESELIARSRSGDAGRQLARHFGLRWESLNDVRKDVFKDLVYNMGMGAPGKGGLLSFQLMIAAAFGGDWDEAAFNLLYNRKPDGKIEKTRYYNTVKGRAEENARMLKNGKRDNEDPEPRNPFK